MKPKGWMEFNRIGFDFKNGEKEEKIQKVLMRVSEIAQVHEDGDVVHICVRMNGTFFTYQSYDLYEDIIDKIAKAEEELK